MAMLVVPAACAPPQSVDRIDPAQQPAAPAPAPPDNPALQPSNVATADAGVSTGVPGATPDAMPQGSAPITPLEVDAGNLDPGGSGTDAPPAPGGAGDALPASPVAAIADSGPIDLAAPSPDGLPAPDAGTPPPAPPRRITFVVGDAQYPSTGDRALRGFLETRGWRVSTVGDSAVSADAGAPALLIISSSCRASALMGKFRDLAIPVITMKASLLDDLDMTGPARSVDFDEEDAQDLTVFDDRHPLAAALRGTIRPTNTPAPMVWGHPSASAIRIAGLASSPAKFAIFAYDKGAAMMTRTAQAKRVAFFATDRLITHATPDGLRLFDAAVVWSMR